MDILALTVKNGSTHELFINRDPNWDDEVLIIDGTPQDQTFTLAVGSSAVVTTGGDEMGVIVSTLPNYEFHGVTAYQLAIGTDSDTGNASITIENSWGSPVVKYAFTDQKPLSATLDFTDGNG